LSKIVQDRKIILGGGNSELRMSIGVEELAKTV
jgi:T-complex protein 1 subunit beta